MRKKLLSFFILFLFIVQPVFAQTIPTGCYMDGGQLFCKAAGITQGQQLITRLINISVTVAFMMMTVWLVWTALKLFITSGGEPKALAHAWSSVTWIFMGLFFMVLAYLAVKLIAEITGANVTDYCLGFPPYCI